MIRRRKKVFKPTDFIIRFGDIPVSTAELELWKPGLITEMGFVEAITWIPVFLGYSLEPMSLAELKPDFQLIKTPTENDPEYEFHKIRSHREDELVAYALQLRELEGLPDTKEIIDQRYNIYELMEAKREELIDADRKLSMISKLSNNSE